MLQYCYLIAYEVYFMTLCAAYQQFLKEKISEGVTEQTLKYYKYNLPKFIEWCVDNKIENRKRNQTLSIRLTDSEKSAINKKSKKAKITLTEYILKSSLQSEIKVIDLQPLLVELKRIGNNLITRKINSGAFCSYNFEEVIDMQRKIYDAIIKLSEDK